MRGVSSYWRVPGRGRPRGRALAVLAIAPLALVTWLTLFTPSPSAEVRRAVRVPGQDPPPIARRLLNAGFPVHCGGGHGDAVALTFDDGPGPFTSATLDILRKHGAAATFFDIGQHMIDYPGILRRELREQEVGNHSWSHPDLPSLSTTAIRSEIIRPRRVVALLNGGAPQWLLRPPYGALDSRVDAVAKSLGLVSILWSVYTGDTADTVLTEAGARPGSIILMHENNDHGATVAALPHILDMLATKGLRPVTLTELLTLDPPTDRQLRTGPYGCGPTVHAVNPREGPGSGNTTVTITGDFLDLPQKVYFGSAQATSVTAVSGHEIRAVAPAGSGTVDVTVTTHFESSPTSALDHYTYR